MKISVIVPVYNVESYLDRCLNSIIAQTYENIEIIVIDDGSTDNSGSICDEYANKDKRIKVIHQENGGLSAARNKGIDVSTGEYLFFVDSDDFIDINSLSEMYNKTCNSNLDLVICDYYNYYDDSNKKHISIIPFYKNSLSSPIISMPTAACKLIKKTLLNGLKFPDKLYFEDNAIMPYVVSLATSYEYIDKPFYYYYQREGSILNKPEYNKKWTDIIEALQILDNLFINNGTKEKYHNEIEYIYIRYLLHASNIKSYRYEDGIENCQKISKIMYEKFPNWRKNPYLKKENLKYKIICGLFYQKRIKLVRMLLRK